MQQIVVFRDGKKVQVDVVYNGGVISLLMCAAGV